MDAPTARDALKELLEKDPPYGAKVTFNAPKAGNGWDAPPLSPWLAEAAKSASNEYYGKPACFQGEGGSIPFMGMLGKLYPEAQFLVTGVLGPASNAHGPNEFLHIKYSESLTCCVVCIKLSSTCCSIAAYSA